MVSSFTLMLFIISLSFLYIIHLSSAKQPTVITNVTAGLQAQNFSPGIERAGPGYGDGFECSKDAILVYQSQTPPLPSGIPTYTVEIYNVCITGGNDTGVCDVSNVHLTCGWFSTARTINPSIFRRLDYDDCLVNDGEPIRANQCITFTYANTYAYPMSVSSVSCY